MALFPNHLTHTKFLYCNKPQSHVVVPVPSDQDRVFYTTKWTKEVDAKFIERLVFEAHFGCYDRDGNTNRALQLSMREVNKCFGTTFDFMFCYIRFLKLKQRYRIFKWITSLSGVRHNPFTNNVECTADGWAYICQKEPFASVYMIKGEQKYDELKCLFQKTPDSPDEEVVVEVIEISSDHETEDKGIYIDGPLKVGAEKVEYNGGFKTGTHKDDFEDTDWWNELAYDTSSNGANNSDGEVSQPSALSLTEQLKGKEKILAPDCSKVTRRLWPDEGSSTASFSPSKKD